MTSRNSSSNQTVKLVLNNIRRNMWLPTLSMLVCFFALPIYTILIIQNSISYIDKETAIIRQMDNIFGFGNEIIGIVVLCGAILAGLSTFAYLHNSIKVDFFHSLPLRRTQIFGINVASATISSVVPYIINVLLALGAACVLGYGEYIDFGAAFAAVGLHIMFFMLLYIMVVFATQLTGKLILNVLLIPFVYLILPACAGVYELMMQMFYKTYVSNPMLESFAVHTSAPWFYFQKISDAAVEMPTVLCIIGIIIAFTAVSLVLFCRRESEAAESALAFKWVRYITTYPLQILGTFLLGVAFYGLGNDSYAWMTFGFICGALIISRIFEIVIASDFKAIKSNFKGLAIFSVIFAALVIIPIFDLTKYDEYVPNTSKVHSASIYINGSGSDFGNNSQRGYFYNYNDRGLSDQVEFREFMYDCNALTGTAEINAVLTLAKEGIGKIQYNETIERNPSATVSVPGENDFDSAPKISYTIRYTLNNGREVWRSYPSLPVEQVKDAVTTIYNNEQYVSNQFKALQLDDGKNIMTNVDFFNDLGDRAVMLATDHYTAEINISDENRIKIAEAYKKDIEKINSDMLFNEVPIGEITLAVLQEENPNVIFDRMLDRASYYVDYPLYANFTNTLAALKTAGIDTSYIYLDINDVTSVDVITYPVIEDDLKVYPQVYDVSGSVTIEQTMQYAPIATKEYYDKYGSDAIIKTYTIENDRAEIEKLLKEVYYYRALSRSMFIGSKDVPEVHIYTKYGDANYKYPIFVK